MNPENHLVELHEAEENRRERLGEIEEKVDFDKSEFLMEAFGIFLNTVDENLGCSFHLHKGMEDDSVLFSIYDEKNNNIYLEDTSDIQDDKAELNKIRKIISTLIKKD